MYSSVEHKTGTNVITVMNTCQCYKTFFYVTDAQAEKLERLSITSFFGLGYYMKLNLKAYT